MNAEIVIVAIIISYIVGNLFLVWIAFDKSQKGNWSSSLLLASPAIIVFGVLVGSYFGEEIVSLATMIRGTIG